MKTFILFIIFCGKLCASSLSFSGNPKTLTINTAAAGSQPNSVTDTSTTYGITSLLTSGSIVGKINTNMPPGVTLSLQLGAPYGATSAGAVPLSTTSVTLVSGISDLTAVSGLSVTYILSATVAASSTTNATRTITLTFQ